LEKEKGGWGRKGGERKKENQGKRQQMFTHNTLTPLAPEKT